jgi:hypothetical protein
MESQREEGSTGLDSLDANLFKVGGFLINIDTISNDDLIYMRQILPQESYRLLKSRKSARICRLRKKDHIRHVTTTH